MTDLLDAVTLDRALASYQGTLDLVEPALALARARIESLPANDPETKLWRAWLWHWATFGEALRKRADIDYQALFVNIIELGDALPGLSSTRPPFPKDLIEAARAVHVSAGFADLEVNRIMDKACKDAMGARRKDRETGFKALRLQMAHKSYPQIANELCPEHGDSPKHGRHFHPRSGDKKLDPCSDKYRAQVRGLKKVLKKYAP
jgi:hypothetical protein